MNEVFGYPVVKEDSFVITKGAAKPKVYESYDSAKAELQTNGGTLTYKVSVPKEEVEAVLAKRR